MRLFWVIFQTLCFAAIVGVTSGLTVFVIIGMGFLYHRARKNAKAAEDVEYPAYGVTGPGKDTSPSSGDRKLAQNAQLYHYQHTKQQMIAFDTNDKERARNGGNISESEDEGEEGDYTVYECPGLAPVLNHRFSVPTSFKNAKFWYLFRSYSLLCTMTKRNIFVAFTQPSHQRNFLAFASVSCFHKVDDLWYRLLSKTCCDTQYFQVF